MLARYEYCLLGRHEVVCTQEKPWHISVSDKMLPQLVRWYPVVMVHVEGMTYLEDTLPTYFHHPELRGEV